ncbi:unnamed protein product [Schistosoma margrebowiei]|uniref:Uncharacterized protein n=1 Tax=Schistosoma margrebowiei TaxID=48269 RepID=A0A183M746_9TREM|nr:unnamed protein product [Schistosoma margrebowiei]
MKTNVKAVLLYGAETWRTTTTTIKKVQVFINSCLRRILNIHWQDTISNSLLWERRPKNTLRQIIEADMKTMNYNWTELERIAQDRVGWRMLVSGLRSFTRSNRRKSKILLKSEDNTIN